MTDVPPRHSRPSTLTHRGGRHPSSDRGPDDAAQSTRDQPTGWGHTVSPCRGIGGGVAPFSSSGTVGGPNLLRR